jgi:hypothetical protein
MSKYLLKLSLLGLSLCSLAPAIANSDNALQPLRLQDDDRSDRTPVNSAKVEEIEQEKLTGQAQQKVKMFATSLKKALVRAIQDDGLAHAVDVCHTVAPKIATSLSSDGWQVGRTSLRTRNTENQPDQWEIQMLEKFDNQFKAGVSASQLAASLNDQGQFRYMQAIPTEQVCLACHGAAIDSALSKVINQHYPNDAASGFTLKDIRGAFTLTKQLAE